MAHVACDWCSCPRDPEEHAATGKATTWDCASCKGTFNFTPKLCPGCLAMEVGCRARAEERAAIAKWLRGEAERWHKGGDGSMSNELVKAAWLIERGEHVDRVWNMAADRPPPKWFLDGKAPRVWRKLLGQRHFCPRCLAIGEDGT